MSETKVSVSVLAESEIKKLISVDLYFSSFTSFTPKLALMKMIFAAVESS